MLKKAWHWVALGVVLAALAALWLYVRARFGQAASNHILADMVDAKNKKKIEELRDRIVQLEALGLREGQVLLNEKAKLEQAKADLQATYQRLDLSAADIERRFDGFRI